MKRIDHRGKRRIGIQGKLTLIIVLLSTLPLLLVGSYVIQQQTDFLKAEHLRRVKSDVNELKERLTLFLSGIEKEIRFLASTTEVRQLIENLQRLDKVEAPAIRAAEQEFANMQEESPSYVNVAFLDPQGADVLSVAYDPATRQAGAGQGSSQRLKYYYVYAVSGMKPGEMKFTPCEIQLPESGLTPAIDCILPLFDKQNELVGILVGSINAKTLFAILDSYNHTAGRVLIADSEGYYLYTPQWKKDWNRSLARREKENVLHDYSSRVAGRILAEQAGTLTEDPERIIEHVTIFSRGDGRTDGYHLIRDIPTREVFAAAHSVRNVFVAGLMGIGLLSALCANWLAHLFLLPVQELIRGTTIIRQGNLDYKLEVQSHDELQDLVENFNQMVAHWRVTRALEEKVRRSEELYSTIVETAHDMIWTLDTEGNFTFINNRGTEICGYKAAEWIGRKFTLMVDAKDLPKVHWVLHETLSGTPQSYEVRLRNENGNGFIFFVNAVPLYSGDTVVGMVNFGTNLTDHKFLEEQLHQSQKMETIGGLAGHVVHEINNPIAIISCKASLLLSDHRKEMSEKIAQDLGKITDLANRVARICHGLLAYCRPSTDASRVAIDIRDPIRKSLSAIEESARSRGIGIEDQLPEPMLLVKGNARELEQVFLHLFVNALDAMPNGGRLRIAGTGDPVRLENGKQGLAVSVEDTGEGIPPELFGRIFEPFFTNKRTGLGAGLGLSICLGFVRSHGGAIELASEVGHGSCFTVKLPLDTPIRKEARNG